MLLTLASMEGSVLKKDLTCASVLQDFRVLAASMVSQMSTIANASVMNSVAPCLSKMHIEEHL